ncbi:MAG: tRNA uridine-5-carboxymethylaminomethyl(34) synthesis GTPase MnmE [Pseudomonadota bacterium]
MTRSTDTIVAAATPPGTGGIGVVRLSGDEVPSIAAKMLGKLPAPRAATLARFSDDNGRPVDTGIALYFESPNSFTGEHVLELQGHGGPQVMALLVEAAVRLGARRARPGEFSERAFLNYKLDLVQAEAIADLIDAGTGQAARAALRSLSGEFSDAVTMLVNELTELRVYVEAAIDFPEEEIDFLSDDALNERLERCRAAFERLERDAEAGRVLRDGYQVVLVGQPNAGKSSLMNRLSGEDTAIVTEIAGTTRDILRETIDVDGLSVELVDTAGLRDNPDVVEREGIRRAREALTRADAALWVRDATSPDRSLESELPEGLPTLVVWNKVDVAAPPAGGDADAVRVSARTGEGLGTLRDEIRRLAGYRNLGEGAFTARQRHVDALADAARHFEDGRVALEAERAGELLAEELRLAQIALGRITGDVSSDELLGRIFSEFCIGK